MGGDTRVVYRAGIVLLALSNCFGQNRVDLTKWAFYGEARIVDSTSSDCQREPRVKRDENA
jgi:hypothetical protein